MVKEVGVPSATETGQRASLPLTAFAKAKAKHNPTWHNSKQHKAQKSRMKQFKANKIKQKMGDMGMVHSAAEELRKARAHRRTREKKQFMKKTKTGQPLMKPRIDKILAALEATK